MPLNLYLDEDCPTLLKDHLLPRGFNVQHVYDVGRGGRSDADHLHYAASIKATLVTFNIKDFVWLHRWWKTFHTWNVLLSPHPGILAAPVSVPVDVLGEAIYHFLTQDPSPVLENNMYIYRRGKWDPERW